MPRARLLLAFVVTAWVLYPGCAHATPEAGFWRWFQKNDAALFDFERDQDRTLNRLAAEMHKVHPSLTFEIGPKKDGRRELVLSADGDREAFPKVESLYAAAPEMRHWKVIKFRPRRPPFNLQYKDLSLKAADVSVLLRPDGDKVAAIVYIPGYTQANRETFFGAAFLLLDQALGEYDVETKVGGIDVRPVAEADPQAVPLSGVSQAFDGLFAKR